MASFAEAIGKPRLDHHVCCDCATQSHLRCGLDDGDGCDRDDCGDGVGWDCATATATANATTTWTSTSSPRKTNGEPCSLPQPRVKSVRKQKSGFWAVT